MNRALCHLRTGDPEKVIVLVHPISGSIIPYVNLASSIQGDVSVYAIFDPVSVGIDCSAKTIEAKASLYLQIVDRELRNIKPVFVGWSMGGLIAFEIVRQYQNINQERGLCMIDACLSIPQRGKNINSNEEYLSLNDRLRLFVEDLLSSKSINFENRMFSFNTFGDCIETLRFEFGFDMSVEQSKILSQMFEAFCINTDALLDYNPEPLDAEIYHVTANIHKCNVKTDLLLWKKTLSKCGVFTSLDEDHYSIIRNKNCVEPAIELVMKQDNVNVG